MRLTLILSLIAFAIYADEQEPPPGVPQKHTVYIRGGRTVDPKSAIYAPVVALVRHFRKFNEKTLAYEVLSSICSGTVINRVCVLTAEHCAEGPGEENLSIEVYNANKIEGAKPAAKVKRALVRKDGAMENDIALLRLDAVAPEEQTLYTSNLHSKKNAPLEKNALVNIVGYGTFNSNYDADSGEWTNVGVGEKRDGDMKVARSIDGRKALIEIEPTKLNHSAGPGDSGGPLIVHENGITTIYGVTGSIDNKTLTNAHTNYYTSVAFHRPWIEATAKELGCTETQAHQLGLEQFVQKNFPNYGEVARALKMLRTNDPDDVLRNLESRIWDSSAITLDPNFKNYQGIKIISAVKDDKGNLVIRWEGALDGLGRDVARRDPEFKLAEGTFVIPPPANPAEPPKRSREGLTYPIYRPK